MENPFQKNFATSIKLHLANIQMLELIQKGQTFAFTATVWHTLMQLALFLWDVHKYHLVWWNYDRVRGERIVFWWPNTNTNIIRVPKNDRIRIRILFGFPKLTEYEYEYYSGFQKWPNTNTNIIRLPKNDQIRIRILFGFPKMTEYEYKYYSTL